MPKPGNLVAVGRPDAHSRRRNGGRAEGPGPVNLGPPLPDLLRRAVMTGPRLREAGEIRHCAVWRSTVTSATERIAFHRLKDASQP